MENTTNLTLADVEKILEQWKVAPPSAEETDLFLSNAISDLNNAEKAEGFKTNIEEVGAWANETDEAFGRVKRGLEDIWEKYGKDFPDLAKFRADWLSYNAVRMPCNHFRSGTESCLDARSSAALGYIAVYLARCGVYPH